MGKKLFIIIVLLSAATLLVFASCDNGATQVDRINLDASPSDFEEGDVSGQVPATEDDVMNALGEVMSPAMGGVGDGVQTELGITCFDTFFDTFFASFQSQPQGGGFQPLDIVEDLSGWDDTLCQGVYKITGSQTVYGYTGDASSGFASLEMPDGGVVFEFQHGDPATWLQGILDINTIDMIMDDFVADDLNPIMVNAKGIVYTDVDVKVDFSNFDVEEGTPSGWITVDYNAFDIQTEIIIAAANPSGYGGIIWLDFKAWIPPKGGHKIDFDALTQQQDPDPNVLIDAIAPGLSITIAVKYYEGPLADPSFDFSYTLEEMISQIGSS